jgi:hypothetical protein
VLVSPQKFLRLYTVGLKDVEIDLPQAPSRMLSALEQWMCIGHMSSFIPPFIVWRKYPESCVARYSNYGI